MGAATSGVGTTVEGLCFILGELEMQETIKDWAAWMSLKKSRCTIKGYVWELEKLRAAYPTKQASDYRLRDLTHYLADRRFRGCGDASIKRSVAAFKSFFWWVSGKKSPAMMLEFPTVHSRRQRSLTVDRLALVLAACDTSTALGKRDAALIALGVDTRLRSSELCRLRVADVDLESRRLCVVIKGGKQSERIFSDETRAMLSAWLSVRSARKDCSCVFVGVGGNLKGQGMTPDGLRGVFRAIGKRGGIGAFSPHDLCRSFAMITTAKGAPSRVVQVGGGWGDLKLVETYTRSLELEAIEKYLPMSGMM